MLRPGGWKLNDRERKSRRNEIIKAVYSLCTDCKRLRRPTRQSNEKKRCYTQNRPATIEPLRYPLLSSMGISAERSRNLPSKVLETSTGAIPNPVQYAKAFALGEIKPAWNSQQKESVGETCCDLWMIVMVTMTDWAGLLNETMMLLMISW